MNFTCLAEAEVLAGAKIEANCLILGDCEKILPFVPKCDAVITDPPYGINIAANPFRGKHAKREWDKVAPSLDFLPDCLKIIWGGNYFDLPAQQGFLIWDKVQPENLSSSQVEYAWHNLQKPAKLFRRHVVSYEKFHPTTKPIELMRWCVAQLPESAQTIFDPFMGSGTTCVAAIEMGRKFIGIEREPSYFEIAKRRCEEAFWRCDMELKSKPGEIDLWNFDKQEEKQ